MNRRCVLAAAAIAMLGITVVPGGAIAQRATAAATADVRQALAPSGKLRVGVYPDSPFSMVRDPVSGETKGIAVELGKALAMRLDVPYQ
jgi:polar amino acid transport system substrate-binding protein